MNKQIIKTANKFIKKLAKELSLEEIQTIVSKARKFIVAGSPGEEAYNISMLLGMAEDDLKNKLSVQSEGTHEVSGDEVWESKNVWEDHESDFFNYPPHEEEGPPTLRSRYANVLKAADNFKKERKVNE